MADYEDSGVLAAAGSCFSCLWDSSSCELNLALICRAPVDLTPIGDVSTIITESSNYMFGYEVDQLDLILAVVGLTATIIVPLTGGTSAYVKVGAAILKMAKGMGKLWPGIMRLLGITFRRAVDWGQVSQASIRHFSRDASRAIRPAAIRPLVRLSNSIGEIYSGVGTLHTLQLIRYIDDVPQARRVALLSRTTTTRSTGYIEFLGKSRVLRVVLKWADEVYTLIAGILAVIYSFFCLVAHVALTRSLRMARRVAQ